MAALNKRRTLFALAGLIILGLIGYVSWPASQKEFEQPTPEAELSVADDRDVGPEDDLENSSLVDPPEVSRSARPLGKTETTRLQKIVSEQAPFPHDVRMDAYKQALWTEILDDPPDFREPGDPELDGETAYRLYMLFGNCSTVPRSPEQVDQNLARIAGSAKTATGKMLERLEHNANQLLDMYELCLMIPPEVDCRMEAVTWMSEAVRLGYEIAEVQFYEKAMGFILRPDRYADVPPLVMLEPGLIEEFKSTARFALSRAMEKRHPEAYLAMSRALADGVVYPRDPVLAYAYLRAAEITAGQNRALLPGMRSQKSSLAAALDESQRVEAENLALQLSQGSRG